MTTDGVVPGAPTDGSGAAGSDAGPTSATAAPTGGPAPCDAPSNAPGVSADTITIGNISSMTGPVPGLGASSIAATRAYVAYVNSIGGVCGRKVEVKAADDGTDNGRFRSLTNELAPSVLGYAGQLGGGDAGGADVVTSLKVPVVTGAISTTFRDAPTVFAVNPPFASTSDSIGKYRYLHSQGVRKAALVYLAVDQTKDQVHKVDKPLIQAAGIQIVNEQTASAHHVELRRRRPGRGQQRG